VDLLPVKMATAEKEHQIYVPVVASYAVGVTRSGRSKPRPYGAETHKTLASGWEI